LKVIEQDPESEKGKKIILYEFPKFSQENSAGKKQLE
jgi:hypothetical protein